MSAQLLAPLFAAIPPPPRSGFELGPLNVRFYGVVIAIGALLAITLMIRRYERMGGETDVAEHSGLLALAGGFLGARIGYVIPRFLNEGPHGAPFIERPLDIFAIWQGGLAFFGGLVGGTLAVVLYLRWRRVALPALADALAPALPLAQAFGRWGNYFNQELFGRPTDLPWALRVDPVPARTAEQFPGATTFHPTFLYESLWNLGLFALLLYVDKKRWLKRRGSLIFIYLIGYGIGRGWIEALRVDTIERYPAVWGWGDWGLSRNNWVAILVVLIGVTGLLWWERKGTGELLADTPGPGTTQDPDAMEDRDATEAPGATDTDEGSEDTEGSEGTDASKDTAGDESAEDLDDAEETADLDDAAATERRDTDRPGQP